MQYNIDDIFPYWLFSDLIAVYQVAFFIDITALTHEDHQKQVSTKEDDQNIRFILPFYTT